MKYDLVTAVFNCNYSCNDSCSFCFNRDDINKSPEMTLEEIENNYFYVKQKYGVNNIIISGGEPSLHTHFWEMMDFFYNRTDADVRPALNTNSLPFANEKKAEQLETLLKNSHRPRKQISLSFSTVDSMKHPNAKEKLKIAGLKNTIRAGLRSGTSTLIVIAVTRTNYEALEDIAHFLVDLQNQYGQENPLSVQLRGLFLGRYMKKDQIDASVPQNFDVISPHIIAFSNILLQNEKIRFRLFNIPLCLIADKIGFESYKKHSNQKAKNEMRMRVDFQSQFLKIKTNTFMETAKDLPDCKSCALKNICNKVQKEYLEFGFIPTLKPIHE